MKMKFVQVTDTHLVPRGKVLHGLDPCERLDACIDDINRHHGDAELCIITGDLVHHGKPQAYRDLKACLSRLRMPCHLLVGNHDHRGRLLDEFPDLQVDGNGFLQTVIETDAGLEADVGGLAAMPPPVLRRVLLRAMRVAAARLTLGSGERSWAELRSRLM